MNYFKSIRSNLIIGILQEKGVDKFNEFNDFSL
jgi:hypothetical protein